MDDTLITLGRHRVLSYHPDGPRLARESDALDLLGSVWGQEVDWLAVPRVRLGPDFLTLRTGLAGAIIQKLVTYRMRLAIVGDISPEVAASDALRDFVRESNSGRHVWFVPDMEAFEAKLTTTR